MKKFYVFFQHILIGLSFYTHICSSLVSADDTVSPGDIKVELSQMLSDYEMLRVTRWTEAIGPEGKLIGWPENFLVAKNKLEQMFFQKYGRLLETEYDFIKFNLLRGLAKKITIIWYDEDGLLEEITRFFQEKKEYVYDEKREHRFVISDVKDIDKWSSALSLRVIRAFDSSLSLFGIGYGLRPFPPHGIIFETDKEEVFIGITPFGFHLGRWKGNEIDQSKLFYSPELALLLADYIDEQNLKNFPKIHINVLTGEDMIQSQIESYKLKGCACPDSLNDVENHETSPPSGKN